MYRASSLQLSEFVERPVDAVRLRVASDYDEDMTEAVTWLAIHDQRLREVVEVLHAHSVEDNELAKRIVAVEQHAGLPVRHELAPPEGDREELQAEEAQQNLADLEEQELYAFGWTPGPGGL